MDHYGWETLISQCSAWRQAMQHGLSQFEEALVQQAKAKRQSENQPNQGAWQGTDCICPHCGRDCHSWIGLLNHTRHFPKASIQKSTLPYSLETEGCLLCTQKILERVSISQNWWHVIFIDSTNSLGTNSSTEICSKLFFKKKSPFFWDSSQNPSTSIVSGHVIWRILGAVG